MTRNLRVLARLYERLEALIAIFDFIDWHGCSNIVSCHWSVPGLKRLTRLFCAAWSEAVISSDILLVKQFQ